jgi:hypothetical protein
MNDFPVTPAPAKAPPILLILVIVLGLGSLLFGILTILFYSQAHTATTTLNTQKEAAASAARTDQKTNDDAENLAASESPYRSYVAPIEYGGFEIKFPKNWSASVDQERSANTQVVLNLNPDFLRRENGTDGLVGTKVMLIQKTGAEYLKQFNGVKTLKQSTTTVSGLNATAITGTFPDKRTTRMVVVPVRDKVIVFTVEASAFASQFDQILAQSKIVP